MNLEASLPGKPAGRSQYTKAGFALHYLKTDATPLDKSGYIG
jgi:hypothetical protein